MTAAGWTVVLALVLAPARVHALEPTTTPEPAGPHTAAEVKTRPIVLALHEVPRAELRDAIALRLPLRPLVDADAPRPESYDYVAIEQRDDGRIALTLITIEGHAYDRVLEVEQDARVRAIASTLANLTFAIESGDVQPDRTDVQPPPPPEPEPEPEPAPVVVTPPPPKPVAPPIAKPPPPPLHELALDLDVGVIAGLAPRTGADAFGGGFGRVGLDLRRRNGALGLLGVRVGGRALEGLSLVRTRIELGGGWAWRWSSFELLLAAAGTVEPWWLQRSGALAPLEIAGSTAQRRPLVGGLARIAPGLRIRAGKTFLRLGAHVELAGSFVPDHGARTIEIGSARSDGTRDAQLRLGGLELVAGLDLAIWFALR
ncbi:MAG TPA: hypothetical protein VG755_12965 [Nannocystaceae bacterium]|nr:hypothetical protein [Nannocystaceae bacterium]